LSAQGGHLDLEEGSFGGGVGAIEEKSVVGGTAKGVVRALKPGEVNVATEGQPLAVDEAAGLGIEGDDVIVQLHNLKASVLAVGDVVCLGGEAHAHAVAHLARGVLEEEEFGVCVGGDFVGGDGVLVVAVVAAAQNELLDRRAV
jgi:hypothetical protein